MKKMKTTVAILLVLGSFSACNQTAERDVDSKEEVDAIASADTAVMYGNDGNMRDAEGVEIKEMGDAFWNDIDFNMPVVKDAGITDADIETRRGDNATIYSLGENLLFDTDKATLRAGADTKLKQIAESIKQYDPQSQIRVYGYTDARASKTYNKELAEDRAEAVEDWLEKNGNIDDNRISVHAVGEARPVASNETASGRQQNRRVEIVAAKSVKE